MPRTLLLLLILLLFGGGLGMAADAQPPEPPSASSETADASEEAELREEMDALRQQLEDFQETLDEHYKEDSLWIDRLTGILTGITVVLVVFSLVLALGAIVGWGRMEQFVRTKVEEDSMDQRHLIDTLRENLRQEIDRRQQDLTAEGSRISDDVRALMQDLETEKVTILQEARDISNRATAELQGRLKGSTALVLGRLSRDPDNYLKCTRQDLLDRAIDAAEGSYLQLKEADSEHQWNAMNNLVFYRALRGDDFAWEQLIDYAEQLRERVEKGMNKPHFLSTYVRVLGEFAIKTKDPAGHLRKAEEVLEALLTDERFSERLRKEARQYTQWIADKKRSLEVE